MLKIYIFQNIEFFGYGLIDSMLNVFQCVFQQKAFIVRKIIMKPRKKIYFFLPVACADIGLPLGRRCPLYRKAGSGHLSAQETQLVMVVAYTAVLGC